MRSAELRSHIQSLVGQEIPTITGRSNVVISIDDDAVLVGTSRSPEGQPVPLEEIEAAHTQLLSAGELAINPGTVGYRSAFIGAVLASLPDAEAETDPPRVRLVELRGQSRRNPPWTYDELVLALDTYKRYGLLDDTDDRVIELSQTLNALPGSGARRISGTFRNPNGVAMKLANFARLDPSYEGTGLQRGARRDEKVWSRFVGRDDELAEAAAEVRAGIMTTGRTLPIPNGERSPEVEQAQEEAESMGRPSARPPRRVSAAERRAVELRAMALATEHYQAEGWQVEDVSATESFDLRCTRSGEELHVEVKGTTSNRPQVVLTRNEVIHAREYASVALVWVSNIELEFTDGGQASANGGVTQVIDRWLLDDGALEALSFAYTLPLR